MLGATILPSGWVGGGGENADQWCRTKEVSRLFGIDITDLNRSALAMGASIALHSVWFRDRTWRKMMGITQYLPNKIWHSRVILTCSEWSLQAYLWVRKGQCTWAMKLIFRPLFSVYLFTNWNHFWLIFRPKRHVFLAGYPVYRNRMQHSEKVEIILVLWITEPTVSFAHLHTCYLVVRK